MFYMYMFTLFIFHDTGKLLLFTNGKTVRSSVLIPNFRICMLDLIVQTKSGAVCSGSTLFLFRQSIFLSHLIKKLNGLIELFR